MLTGDSVIRAVWEFAPMFRPTSNGSRRSRCGLASPESRTILRMTYGWVRMPDAIVRYALASSSKFTSEAPKAVVA